MKLLLEIRLPRPNYFTSVELDETTKERNKGSTANLTVCNFMLPFVLNEHYNVVLDNRQEQVSVRYC